MKGRASALAIANGGQGLGIVINSVTCLYLLLQSVAVIILAEAVASFTGTGCFSQKS